MKNELQEWQKIILDDAIEFEFIKSNEFDEAVRILKEFNNADDFFYECSEREDALSKNLADASQI
jgi:hypothetical protein